MRGRRTIIGGVSLVLAAVSLNAFAQVKLKVEATGFPESTATAHHKILPNGQKLTQLSIEIAVPNGRRVYVKTDRWYAADGTPTRIFHEVSSTRPVSRKQITVTFNDSGAHAVIDEGGKRQVKDIPLAQTAPRACLSEFWFLRDKPTVGASIKYYHFDVSKLEWGIVEATYEKDVKFKLGKTSVQGHMIRMTNGEAVVDDMGLPLRFTDGNVTMTRLPS